MSEDLQDAMSENKWLATYTTHNHMHVTGRTANTTNMSTISNNVQSSNIAANINDSQ